MSDASLLTTLVEAIVAHDEGEAGRLVEAWPELATAQFSRGGGPPAADRSFHEIEHYMYGGDTALHMAAAAHHPEVVTLLVDHGAAVHARNRRGAQPLHYAADGLPDSPSWNPLAQAQTVTRLIAAGADPNAVDTSGVAPLHRAVRTRCALAVSALLQGGADPDLENGKGSTPMDLARKMTGRGGSASAEAKEQQAGIVDLLTIRVPSR